MLSLALLIVVSRTAAQLSTGRAAVAGAAGDRGLWRGVQRCLALRDDGLRCSEKPAIIVILRHEIGGVDRVERVPQLSCDRKKVGQDCGCGLLVLLAHDDGSPKTHRPARAPAPISNTSPGAGWD